MVKSYKDVHELARKAPDMDKSFIVPQGFSEHIVRKKMDIFFGGKKIDHKEAASC